MVIKIKYATESSKVIKVTYDTTPIYISTSVSSVYIKVYSGLNTNGGTVRSIATTAPITGGTITASGTIGITQSGIATDGYLSSTDWNTFNSKIGGSGTINYVPKFTGTGTIGNSIIFDDGSNVGINIAPIIQAKLYIGGNFSTLGSISLDGSGSVNRTLSMENFPTGVFTIKQGADAGSIILAGGSTSPFVSYINIAGRFNVTSPGIQFGTRSVEKMRIFDINGNILIQNGGTFTDAGYKLDVNGTTRLNGVTTIGTINAATTYTDKFLVSDSGVVKFRTGAEVLSDIGGQGALTLTTTGTSGAATLIGNTLNVPQYEAEGNYVTTATTITINGTTYDLSANRSWSVGTVTSVGLTMPVAFAVGSSPITGAGTLAVTAIGTSSQYIRGDGQLATLPSGASGGSSVNYYLNGSVAASVAGYKHMANSAIIGGGTDFTLVGNGLIAQFLTDVANPNRLLIPGGAWNFEMFFNVSSSGGNTKFYVELLKYDGATFTSIASSSAVAEEITGGTTIDLYVTSLAVPETVLLTSDRLAVRVYIVDNSGGRTVTLHTENNTLCEIITTFAGGIAALNGLTANTQYLAVGTSGTDFAISSVTDTHTFNLPTASAANRGALSSADWSTFNGKQNALTNPVTGTGTTNYLPKFTGATTLGDSNIQDSGTLITLGSDSRINGNVSIGSNPIAASTLYVVNQITGNSTAYGMWVASTVQSDVTVRAEYFGTSASTQATTFTIPNLVHFRAAQGTFGAGSTVTIQQGFIAAATLIGGITNYGFRGSIPSGAGRWNIYMDGSAINYLNGALLVGSAADDTINKLQVTGGAKITGSITASSAIARGALISSTLVAAANNDVLVGLDINPTFTVGAFTGTTILGLRVNGTARFSGGTIAGAIFGSGTTVNLASDAYMFATSTTGKNAGYTANRFSTSQYASFDLITGASYLAGWSIQMRPSQTRLDIVDRYGTENVRMSFFSGGNVAINSTTDAGFKLDVNGTARINGVPIGRGNGTSTTNTAFGEDAMMLSAVTGTGNTAIGRRTGRFITSGINNTFIGNVCGLNVSTGSNNVCLGFASGNSLTTSFGNVIIGSDAYQSGNADSVICIGRGSGYYNTGTNNVIFIDNRIRANAAAELTDSIIYGLTSTNLSNQILRINARTGVGLSADPVASAQFQIDSTTRGFLPPRMTTTQKNAIATPAAGLMVYDTTTNKLCCYNGTIWNDLF